MLNFDQLIRTLLKTLKLVERMLKEYYDMNELGKSDFHVAIGEAVQEVVDTALEPD